jgi:hypothetical protein
MKQKQLRNTRMARYGGGSISFPDLNVDPRLQELGASLGRRGVQLSLEFSSTLHDREIRLDSGWIVKIGRGLDIYQAPEGKMVIGYFEMEHRACQETTVDIFFKKNG